MKTAIEWYQKAIFEILKEKENLSDEIFLQNILNAHLQAKEMEFQQMKKSYYTGCASELFDYFEQYYNENYKKTNK
jgi:hypothetical protein